MYKLEKSWYYRSGIFLLLVLSRFSFYKFIFYFGTCTDLILISVLENFFYFGIILLELNLVVCHFLSISYDDLQASKWEEVEINGVIEEEWGDGRWDGCVL
ncbi:hypothetical protein Pfo_017426, partial [Paulownia fortunei]